MNRHRKESLFLLCVIGFNATCAASQGEPGSKGTYPRLEIMLAGTPPHFSSLLISRSLRDVFEPHDDFLFNFVKCLLWCDWVPEKAQVGADLHFSASGRPILSPARMRPHFLFIPTLFVFGFSFQYLHKSGKMLLFTIYGIFGWWNYLVANWWIWGNGAQLGNTQTHLLFVNADIRHFLSWIWSLVVQLELPGNSWWIV